MTGPGIAQLSLARGGFYVPACRVQVGGKDLVHDHYLAVSQVEADLVLGAPGRFSFTVVNCYDNERRTFVTGHGEKALEVLLFGAPVIIAMGYGDVSDLKVLLTGTITEISTSFPESGSPELTIAGYDKGFPLTVGKNSKSWRDSSDSDAVTDIARARNLDTKIDATKEKFPLIQQNQEGDFEFIKKLAERNHYEFYVRGDTLHFSKPKDKGDGVVKLSWGEGLLSFRPEANLAGQVGAVEVYGWDVAAKKEIVGKASAGAESGRPAGSESAGDKLGEMPGQKPILRFRQPVYSQAEADQRALAAFNEKAKKFLTGDAESIGLPEILPDDNVMLDNLGKAFSMTYYVQQATHKFDGSGYRTKFKVKEAAVERP